MLPLLPPQQPFLPDAEVEVGRQLRRHRLHAVNRKRQWGNVGEKVGAEGPRDGLCSNQHP